MPWSCSFLCWILSHVGCAPPAPRPGHRQQEMGTRVDRTFFFGLLDRAPRPYVSPRRASRSLCLLRDDWQTRGAFGVGLSPRRKTARTLPRAHTVRVPGRRPARALQRRPHRSGLRRRRPIRLRPVREGHARRGRLSAEDMKKALLNAVRKFTHNRPPEDDQTLLVVASRKKRRTSWRVRGWPRWWRLRPCTERGVCFSSSRYSSNLTKGPSASYAQRKRDARETVGRRLPGRVQSVEPAAR